MEPGFAVFAAQARLGELEAREWTYVCEDGSHATARHSFR